MKRFAHIRTLFAALLIAVVVVGGYAPERAHAQWATTLIGGIGDIQETISAVADVAQTASDYAMVVDKYVLEPIAFVTSGNLLKSLTAGVLKFVNGITNGTGAKQFVQNLRANLQTVSDTQALTFLLQFGKNNNSPFASSIVSSLKTQYLQQSSLAGFFAANKCTLSAVSPSITGFVNGNWSMGGANAWFALTTQTQNNPFILHQRAQAELAGLVMDAMNTQATELNWGQGILSWCDTTDQSATDYLPAEQNIQAPQLTDNGDGTMSPKCPAGTTDTADGCVGPSSCPSGYDLKDGNTCVPTDATQKANSCTNADGSPGTIKTPGSVIKDGLQKALGADVDKLVNLGNAAAQINGILGNIANVMNTINYASALFGGSGGIAGLGSGPSTSSNANNSYLGLSTSAIADNAANSGVSTNDFSTRVDQYATAWATLATAANTASSSLNALSVGCATQTSAADTARTTLVAPVLAQAATAQAQVAEARTQIAKINGEKSSAPATYATDLAALSNLPPTIGDVGTAQGQARITGFATSTPSGSLNVTGGSTVDQMNLIATNANALKAACFLPTP